MYAAVYAKQAAQQYKTTQVRTANPADLVVMMYDGAIRFIRQGVAAIEAADFEEAHRSLVRAQDIISELDRALDPQAGEIAANLAQLYDYIHRRLVEGNVRKDAAPLQEVIGLLTELRDAWAQIARGEGGAGGGGHDRA
ncbi:MAG: flagellar export chaperone FliS [Firmicutes bacterium ZCTH02-B6]|nr:MAG: flagellar export chaperone FliS [Firmicutes bacterium ZCTH02-B6]